MPNVNGEKYPYTPEGRAAAKKETKESYHSGKGFRPKGEAKESKKVEKTEHLSGGSKKSARRNALKAYMDKNFKKN